MDTVDTPVVEEQPTQDSHVDSDVATFSRRQIANAAMERYASGDDDAFPELYDALAPALFRYLLRKTRDRARAEDLLQQTLLQIHAHRGRFFPGADVMPWAFAIAYRLFVSSLRRLKRDSRVSQAPIGEFPANTDPADDLLHSKRLARAMEDQLSQLPEAQRVAFELIKCEGLSLREVAEMLGVTVTAVKLRVHRAYVALRASAKEASVGNEE